jgi:hypothetical protein
MKPSCTELVSQALWESLSSHRFFRIGTAAVPDNWVEKERSTAQDTTATAILAERGKIPRFNFLSRLEVLEKALAKGPAILAREFPCNPQTVYRF